MMRPMPNEGSITEGVKLLRAPDTQGPQPAKLGMA